MPALGREKKAQILVQSIHAEYFIYIIISVFLEQDVMTLKICLGMISTPIQLRIWCNTHDEGIKDYISVLRLK